MYRGLHNFSPQSRHPRFTTCKSNIMRVIRQHHKGSNQNKQHQTKMKTSLCSFDDISAAECKFQPYVLGF